MARRQDGPGGYHSFFPLAYRKKRFEDVIRVEDLTQADRARFNEMRRRESLARKNQEIDVAQIRIKLRALFGNDPVTIKRVTEVLDPQGCNDLILWVAAIDQGQIGPLPDRLVSFFKMPLRAIAEASFATWLCRSCPQQRNAIIEQMRRAACLHLLEKCQVNFVNPHSEVLSFVSGLSPFALYEIGYTEYQPTAIARLGQLLRRNGRMR